MLARKSCWYMRGVLPVFAVICQESIHRQPFICTKFKTMCSTPRCVSVAIANFGLLSVSVAARYLAMCSMSFDLYFSLRNTPIHKRTKINFAVRYTVGSAHDLSSTEELNTGWYSSFLWAGAGRSTSLFDFGVYFHEIFHEKSTLLSWKQIGLQLKFFTEVEGNLTSTKGLRTSMEEVNCASTEPFLLSSWNVIGLKVK